MIWDVLTFYLTQVDYSPKIFKYGVHVAKLSGIIVYGFRCSLMMFFTDALIVIEALMIITIGRHLREKNADIFTY